LESTSSTSIILTIIFFSVIELQPLNVGVYSSRHELLGWWFSIASCSWSTVTLHRTRLVLGWVTVSRSSPGRTTLIVNKPLRPTQSGSSGVLSGVHARYTFALCTFSFDHTSSSSSSSIYSPFCHLYKWTRSSSSWKNALAAAVVSCGSSATHDHNDLYAFVHTVHISKKVSKT